MGKRERAIAIIIKDGKFLLVKDRGVKAFSLPGGRIEENETILEAAVREIYEETGLEPIKAVRLKECDYEGKVNFHRVCFLETENYDIKLNKRELKDYIWWDGKEEISAYNHAREIISRFKKLKEKKNSSVSKIC